MTIFTVTCSAGCRPMYYSALNWAEAGMKAHFICRGHDCAINPEHMDVDL